MLDRISLDSVPCSEPRPESRGTPEPGRGMAVRPYRCQHCQARFTAKKSLMLHMRRHVNEKPFACAHCPRRFSQRSALVMHERSHTSEAQAPFSCEECGRRFRFSKALATHLRDAHLGRPLKCAACDALFLTTGGLQEHEELRHGIVPPPAPKLEPEPEPDVESAAEPAASPAGPSLFKQNTTCYVCDKDFPTHSAMLVHARVHGAGSRFRCRQCPAHFSSWISLRSHWRIHSRANIHKCKLCPLRFGARTTLLNHLKQHDRAKGGNIVRCVKCLEAFDSRKALHAHVKAHHEESKEANPPPAAPRQSTSEPEVQERSKSDPKLYFCQTCPDVFDKYWNYWNHRKNLCPGVTGKPAAPSGKLVGKGFRCSTCGMRFKTRKLLYWHSQRHLVKSEPGADAEIQQTPAKDKAAEVEPTSASASPQKTFRCGKCSQPFPDRRALHIHSKTHSGAMVVIGVEDETMMQLDSSGLQEEGSPANPTPASAKKAKTSKNVFRCGQCGQSYRGRKLLWRHRKSCGIEDKMAGDEDMSAGTNDSVIKVETRPKKYRCTKCSEVFPDADSHWLHYKVHVTESIHEVVHSDAATDPLASPSYKCRTCAQVFPHRISLWWHYKSHLNDVEAEATCVSTSAAVGDPLPSTFRCEECPEEFPDEDLHWQHYKTHVSDVCEEVRQEKANEVEVQASYQCKKCSKTFMDERSHWVHYKVHADLPALAMYEIVKPANGQREGMPGQYRCSRCLELFADLEGHWWHFRTHYEPEELSRLELPVPARVGEGEDGLTAPDRSLYKCSQCPELFEDERSRWWHYRIHATDSSTCFEMVRSRPEYRCVKCSQVFPDVANHWLHFRTHYEAEVEVINADAHVNGKATPSPAEKQYRCSKCPELFENPEAHWKHYRQHFESVCREVSVSQDPGEDTTTYRCSKCDQVSDDLEAHWWHYRTHMDVGEDEELELAAGTVAFRCVECAETFPDADSHWAHYRRHVEEAEVCEEVAAPDVKPKLYPCTKCPEVFPDRRSRFLHCAVHVTPRGASAAGPSAPVLIDKDKGLQCNACQEIFLDTESHWWHYKTVHNVDAEQVGPETYQIVELTNDPTEDPMTKRCQCSKCPETFPNRKAHHRHYKAVHAMEGVARSPLMVGSFPCSRCPEVFADRKSHWWHYRAHTDASGSAAVELAGERAGEPGALQTHMEAEPGEPAEEDAGDAAEEVAATHTENDAPAPKEYRCSRCPEMFPDLEQHWWHYRVHTDEEFVASVKGLEEQMPHAETTPSSGKYQCSKCPESFPDRKAHWAHYKTHKTATPQQAKVSSGTKTGGEQQVKQTKKHQCNVCSKVFQLWINLFNHKKSHDLAQRAAPSQEGEATVAPPAAETPAQSTTSVRKFPSSGRSLCSPSVVVGRSFKCSHCPARLSSRRLLWAHFKTHKQSNRSYPCGECDAQFNSRGALRAHVGAHAVELDPLASIPEEQSDSGYPCSKCDAVFKNKVALGSHQRVHPAPKPFKCNKCGARFTNGNNMLRHMRITHLKSKK